MELKNHLDSINYSIYSDDSNIQIEDNNHDFISDNVRLLEKDTQIEIINENKSRDNKYQEEVASYKFKR